MTKAIKHMYRIQYCDNTYQVVDWSKKEFTQVGEDIANGKKASLLDEGVFVLGDVRAIVYLPPPPPPTEEEINEAKKQAESQLSEWGFVDPETAQWLKAQGIEVGGVV